MPTRLPGALLVIGAGAIGIEFASFYHDMGSEVTVVEALPRILPAEDEEIAAAGAQELRQARHRDPHRRDGAVAAPRARRRHRGDRPRRRLDVAA